VLHQIFDGENIGTVVGHTINPHTARKMPGRKRWIAFYHYAQGSIYVDDGAKVAISIHGKSLLPVGICGVKGEFERGAVIEIFDKSHTCFAKGIIQLNRREVDTIIAHYKSDQNDKKESWPKTEVVHRDNLVILRGNS
jgi:glutamate 5-kinase